MKSKHLILFILVNLSLFLTNCKKPLRDNPWDEKATLNPNDWAPQELTIKNLSISQKELLWTFGDQNIEGFKVDRKKGDEPWQEAYATLPKEARSWNDDNIIPDPQLTFQYRLYAVAGKNISGIKTISENAIFPAPTDLIIERKSIVSVNLSWNYNTTGQEGFIIERKQGNEKWEQIATTIAANFIDHNFEINTTIFYRIVAYCGQYHTEFLENYFTAEIPPPENLKITMTSISSLKLTWNYSFTDHQGFVIDKKVNNSSWINGFVILDPNQRVFIDNDVNLGISDYTYRVFVYYNEFISIIPEVQIQLPKIGQLSDGGIIFYLNNNGGGLVCAEFDQSTNALWGCMGSLIGGTSFEIGTGASNTALIVAGCSTSEIAARICNDIVINGYSDWFLPSLDESGEMLRNLGPNGTGTGGFADDYYWSSAEFSNDLAWMYYFTGSTYKRYDKNQSAHVRAVRAF